jgi:hypothetical protein
MVSRNHPATNSQMPSVFTATTFPTDKLNFGKHKPNPNGGFNIELSIGPSNSDEILLQTPKMRCPFGISTDKTNPFKKSLDISFQGIEANDNIKAFRKIVESIDNLAIDYAHKNSKAFFKQEYSREVISAYYSSNIKLSKKEQYSDTFRSKLLYIKPDEAKKREAKYLTIFWEIGSKPIERDETYLDKGDSVSILIKPQMLWIGNKQFGVQWICTQVQVTKNIRATAYAFKKTDESDDEDHVAEAVETAMGDTISDSGSEEEVEVDA